MSVRSLPRRNGAKCLRQPDDGPIVFGRMRARASRAGEGNRMTVRMRIKAIEGNKAAAQVTGGSAGAPLVPVLATIPIIKS